MDSTPENNKKHALDDLSKEELLVKCKSLLGIAQKAKQAKDVLNEENTKLKNQLERQSNDGSQEIIENLTQQKLGYVTTIEDLKNQNKTLQKTLSENVEATRLLGENFSKIDSENISLKRQTNRLTDENEQLLTHLDSLEKQIEELNKIGLEQRQQLLELEKNNSALESQPKGETPISKIDELQNMLSISLVEVQKLKTENETLKNTSSEFESLKLKFDVITSENEKKLQFLISSDATSQETINKLKEKLKIYHSKIVKFATNVKHLKDDKNVIIDLFKSYTEQVNEWKNNLNFASTKLLELVNKLESENKELIKENNHIKEANSRIIEELEAHKTDDEKSKNWEEFEHLKQSNLELLESNNTLESEIINLKSKINDEDEFKNKVQEENLNLKESVQSMQEKIQNLLSETENLKQKNDALESEKNKLEIIISSLENQLKEVDESKTEINSLRNSINILENELEHSKKTEKRLADKSGEEIIKLVDEIKYLTLENTDFKEKLYVFENARQRLLNMDTQTDDSLPPAGELEEKIATLKRENSELLAEMNEMNQALKERGENISKLQSHGEEIMKKLQIYETQANKNVNNLTQKEEIIKQLQQEINALKIINKSGSSNSEEVTNLKAQIESLKEQINSNLDNSYAESENMSTSTVSRSEKLNNMDLDSSWEERYSKLRTLAIKLKAKIKELTNELGIVQKTKAEIQEKLDESLKNIQRLETNVKDANVSQTLLQENEILKLKNEVEGLAKEKSNMENWKKQIATKVQALRKELEADKLLQKEYESKINKITKDMESKETSLKKEIENHQTTKELLDQLRNETKKNSVLNLEMQDFEKSVKDLSTKLDKKEEVVNNLKSQVDTQKTTINALREQHKILEEKMRQQEQDLKTSNSELISYKKKLNELEESRIKNDAYSKDLTKTIESIRLEKEDLSTDLSNTITDLQKTITKLKTDKEEIRNNNITLSQNLRETKEILKLKETELVNILEQYEGYKVRAQSVLKQNQNRDVGLEEKLSEEVSSLKSKLEEHQCQISNLRTTVEDLTKENNLLKNEKQQLESNTEEIKQEICSLQNQYDQLLSKHNQCILEHNETIRGLKIHADTLSQCYRQQISEQEVRHNREIIDLQSKLEKAPSPSEAAPLPGGLPTMPREEGEGSESVESTNGAGRIYPVPLERLLASDMDQEIDFMKKQLKEQESKVNHLTELLADTEQDLVKHVQMNKMLKEEIRRQERAVEREKHAENLEYLKNIVFKFVTLNSGDERSRLVPVLNTILKLSPEETHKLNLVAKGEATVAYKVLSNYLPSWSPGK